MCVSSELASLQKEVLTSGRGFSTTPLQGMAHQMTEGWLAFGNLHISKLAVTTSGTAPQTCHKVYLYVMLCSKVGVALLLPAPADVNT